jgi:hypothetical protein
MRALILLDLALEGMEWHATAKLYQGAGKNS